MARPLIEIDPKEVERLAAIGCKNEEIADWFSCSTDTIENRFSGELTKGRAHIRMSLRRWQLDAAKAGNPTMLIWLGKQMLKQSDQIDLQVSQKERPLKDVPNEELDTLRLKLINGSSES